MGEGTGQGLQNGELRFRNLLEKLPAGAYTCDAEGLITYYNQHAVQLWGRAPKLNDPEDRYCGSFKLFAPDGAPIAHDRCWMALALKNNKEYNGREIVVERPDGQRLTALAHANPIHDESGNLLGAVNVLVDISDRKRAQEEIEARARQQSVVADFGRRALAEPDLTALMQTMVQMVVRTLDVEYAKVLELLPEGDALLLRAGVGWKKGLVGRAIVPANSDSQAGYTLLVDRPVIVEVLSTERRFSGPALLHQHEVVSGLSVIVRGREGPFGVLGAHTRSRRRFTEDDVNFLRAMANVLAEAIEWRKAEEAMQKVRETERNRMAHDMHDEVLQDLLYALHELQSGQGDSLNGGRGGSLEQATTALRRSVEGLRTAIFDLRLEGESSGTFVEQLEELVALNSKYSPGRQIKLLIQKDLHISLEKSTEVEILRVLQETLANVRRHSEACHVRVAVGASESRIWVEVSDDGRGFDASEELRGIGIEGMRERARRLGGELAIATTPGEGTTVRFEVALQRECQGPQKEAHILLVEDHASFRQAAASVFREEPGFAVVGQAGSLTEARQMLDGVDVAVVDLGLPDGYGGDLIKDLRAANPHAMTLVLSANLDRTEMARAVEAGAAGILHKSASMTEVVESIRRLRAGEMLISLEEAVELLRFASSRREQEYEARGAIAQLTPREIEVLQALAQGLDGENIAEQLYISTKTERNHMASIFTKLGVHSRLQALVFALRYGIVEIQGQPSV